MEGLTIKILIEKSQHYVEIAFLWKKPASVATFSDNADKAACKSISLMLRKSRLQLASTTNELSCGSILPGRLNSPADISVSLDSWAKYWVLFPPICLGWCNYRGGYQVFQIMSLKNKNEKRKLLQPGPDVVTWAESKMFRLSSQNEAFNVAEVLKSLTSKEKWNLTNFTDVKL